MNLYEWSLVSLDQSNSIFFNNKAEIKHGKYRGCGGWVEEPTMTSWVASSSSRLRLDSRLNRLNTLILLYSCLASWIFYLMKSLFCRFGWVLWFRLVSRSSDKWWPEYTRHRAKLSRQAYKTERLLKVKTIYFNS